jgi:hypothetical protein
MASPWAGLPIGALPILLVAGLLIALGQLEPAGPGNWIPAAVLFPVFLAMAFLEEVACRGYLLRNLVESGRTVRGVVYSSAVFAAFHMLLPEAWESPVNLLNIYLAGVLFSLICLLARNLWFPTAIHFSWNYCQGAVLGIPVSGIPLDGLLRLDRPEASSDWLTGGEFGLEGSVLTLAILAILTLLLAALLRRRDSAAPAAAPPGS